MAEESTREEKIINWMAGELAGFATQANAPALGRDYWLNEGYTKFPQHEATARVALPQPKVLPGDIVAVQNYRTKHGVWEKCTVIDMDLHVRKFGSDDKLSIYWGYRCKTMRAKNPNNPVLLTVTDARIKPIDTDQTAEA